MADYPEWVLAHKKKGTYISKVGDKYYLYAAHSKRIPGTKKVKRIFDGYLGRITEKDGLIPSKDKVSGEIFLYEYGRCSLILSLCGQIHQGLRRTFVKNGDFIMAASILTYLYGTFTEELYRHSWLCLRFPSLAVPSSLTTAQTNGIQRGSRMIADTMERVFADDLAAVFAAFSLMALVSINNKLYCCPCSDSVSTVLKQYHLDWRFDQWQN